MVKVQLHVSGDGKDNTSWSLMLDKCRPSWLGSCFNCRDLHHNVQNDDNQYSKTPPINSYSTVWTINDGKEAVQDYKISLNAHSDNSIQASARLVPQVQESNLPPTETVIAGPFIINSPPWHWKLSDICVVIRISHLHLSSSLSDVSVVELCLPWIPEMFQPWLCSHGLDFCCTETQQCR